MTYREGRALRLGHHAAGQPRAHALVERDEPRLVALFTHDPQPVRGVAPLALIEELAARVAGSPALAALFAAVDDALAAIVAEITDPDEEFSVGWSFGAHAIALEQLGAEIRFAGSGNARLYRARDGRVTTIFGGQTLFSMLPAGFVDPAELPEVVETVVVAFLGGGRRDGAARWHGPERVDARAGDRFLMTTLRSVQRLTTDDLQHALSIEDRTEAARAVVDRGRAAAKAAGALWHRGEAVVVDVAG